MSDGEGGELILEKKKKKKKTVTKAEVETEANIQEQALDKEKESAVEGVGLTTTTPVAPDDEPEGEEELPDLGLELPKKKKKAKASKITFSQDVTYAPPEDLDKRMQDKRDGVVAETPGDWQDSDRDYTYEELLHRVIKMMREKNPELLTSERKIVMKPPQVMRVGTKKTSFSNFAEICKQLKRQPKHLSQFLEAELGTNGNLDGNNQFIIKGRFQQKQIESVLRRYIREYVSCHTCKSPDTMLQRDTRLDFLLCKTCGSRCSVAAIKAGFHAQIGKRAALRNKAAT